MRELYSIICGKEAGKGEETIDDIAKYLNDNLDYGDLDEEIYDRGEKLLNSLNKFDEFYNSLNDDSPSKKNSKRKNDIGIPF
jgi:DNA-binding transcriptional regulator GbsR (MarR family)